MGRDPWRAGEACLGITKTATGFGGTAPGSAAASRVGIRFLTAVHALENLTARPDGTLQARSGGRASRMETCRGLAAQAKVASRHWVGRTH